MRAAVLIMMADLGEFVVGHTIRWAIEIGSLEVLNRPSTHCAGLLSMFDLLLRFAENAVRHAVSSSSISRVSLVKHRHARGCS